MKNCILYIAIMFMLATCVSSAWAIMSNPIDTLKTGEAVAHFRFLVKTTQEVDSTELSSALTVIGCEIKHKYTYNNWYLVRFDSGAVEELYDSLDALEEIASVNYDWVVSPTLYTPSESQFADQWPLTNTDEQSVDTDVHQAWSFTRGSRNTGIFLLDSGWPDWIHPDWDQYPDMRTFPVTTTDGNSTINFCPGDEPGLSCYNAAPDGLGHSTIMGGVIIAEHDGTYLAGIAPETYLVCANFLFRFTAGSCTNPGGFYSSALEALEWVIVWNHNPTHPYRRDHQLGPIRAVNASWGYPRHRTGEPGSDDALLEFLQNQFASEDILLISSGGHILDLDGDHDPDLDPPRLNAPARWSGMATTVLAVNAFDRTGAFAWYSNSLFPDEIPVGPLLGGPGGFSGFAREHSQGVYAWPCMDVGDHTYQSENDVLVTWPGAADVRRYFNRSNPYDYTDYFGGTSVATAHVSGVAALVLALQPNLSHEALVEILTESAIPGDERNGSGRLNALRAVMRTPGQKTLQYNLDLSPETNASQLLLEGELVIPTDLELSIEGGMDIELAPGARITVSGSFFVGGNVNLTMGVNSEIVINQGGFIYCDAGVSNSIQFAATGTQPEDSWRGIFLNSTGNSLTNCVFENASCAIRALSGSDVTLTNCTFTNCGTAIVSANGRVTTWDCAIDVRGQYGIVGSSGVLDLHRTEISSANRTGIWAHGYTNSTLDSCTITNCGIREDEQTYMNGGIRNTFGHMTLRCVSSTDNHGPGLAAFGGFTDMAPVSNISGKNTIKDNHAPEAFPRAQIYFENAQFDLCKGRNKICGADGWQIMDATPTAHDVTYNYWCDVHTYPAEYVNNGDDPSGVSNRCNLLAVGDCEETEAAAMFREAWEMENTMLYQDAYFMYKDIMEFWPASDEAKLCPERMIFCAKMMESTWSDQRAYFLYVADTTSNDALQFECYASAVWCLVEMDSLTEAEAEFLHLLDEADDDYKYQKATLSALMVELQEAPWDTIGILDSAPDADPMLSVLDRMESVLNGHRIDLPSSTPVPSAYALYQNYPNPFNPITEIRFDLPERADVELQIFNILGREVATIAQGSFEAGEHTVKFDASGMASGVYIYSLKTGTFRAERKMLLLK